MCVCVCVCVCVCNRPTAYNVFSRGLSGPRTCIQILFKNNISSLIYTTEEYVGGKIMP
jgi:hypothetical protein